MKVVSDFYVYKVTRYAGVQGLEVTLHACGDNLVEPPAEMVESPLDSPAADFVASGAIILRVTNARLMEAFRHGTKYHVTLEEIPGSVHLPQSPDLSSLETRRGGFPA